MSRTPIPTVKSPRKRFQFQPLTPRNARSPFHTKSVQNLISQCNMVRGDLMQIQKRMNRKIKKISNQWHGAKKSIEKRNNKFNSLSEFKHQKQRLNKRLSVMKMEKSQTQTKLIEHILDYPNSHKLAPLRGNQIPKKVPIENWLTMKEVQDHDVAVLLANNKREFGKPFKSQINLKSRLSRKRKKK